tara:strand:- start:417 stop:1340 length:924 start_codon:yes stop_codon:yes gene_type:complete
MIKILITEFMNQSAIDLLNKKFDIIYDNELWNKEELLKKNIQEVDCIVVRNKTQLNSSVLLKAKKLKFIGRLGVGLDNIDTNFSELKNIKVQIATGMNADSVAEYVINCSLSLLRKLPNLNTKTLKGEWPRTTISSNELQGKTLGIIGFGLIGRKVANLATAFGVNILAYDPYLNQNDFEKNIIKLTTLEKIFSMADIISIHLPLSENTLNLINQNSFLKMKNKPLIINSSRGGIINEEDLLDAYFKKHISGFAIDVYQNEPVEKNFLNKIKPDMNCILTPHIAGITEESNERVSKFIADKIIDFFK